MAAVLIARGRGWRTVASMNDQIRKMSVNGRRAFIGDTLDLGSRLKEQGMPSNQAQVITSAITEVIKMNEMALDTKLFNFKSEVQSLQREIEKVRVDIKTILEHRSEIDNIIAKQRLKLMLERLEELARDFPGTSDRTNKPYQGIPTLSSQLKEVKSDVTNYFIFTWAWLSAVSVPFFGKMMET